MEPGPLMGKAKRSKLSASQEDYLEAIFNLAEGDAAVRGTDVAAVLAVSKASVTGALRGLRERGLVHYEPYGTVTLTDAGRKRAAEVAQKHEVLRSFFVDVLGVEDASAQQAACRAEHTLGPDITSQLFRFVQFVGRSHAQGRDLVAEFRSFCQDRRPGAP